MAKNRHSIIRVAALASVALSPLDAINVQAGPIGLRAYMVPALIAIVGAATLAWRPGNHTPATRLLVWFTLLVVASLLWTISAEDTIQVAFGQVFLLLWLLALLRLGAHEVFIPNDLLVALLVGLATSSAVAFGQTVLALGGLDTGVWRTLNSPLPRPTGLTREPVWAALNATVGLAAAAWAAKGRTRVILITLFTSVLVFTYSRAAIFAVAGALMLVTLIMLIRVRKLAPRTQATLTLAITGALILGPLAVMVFPDNLLTRFDILGALSENNAAIDQGALASRLGVNAAILDSWQEQPIWGRGGGSVATIGESLELRQIYAGGGELNSGRGAANLLLSNLYDLGLIGLFITILLLLSLIVVAWRMREESLAPLFILCVVFVQFSASNGVRLGVFWAVISVILATYLSARRMRHSEE